MCSYLGHDTDIPGVSPMVFLSQANTFQNIVTNASFKILSAIIHQSSCHSLLFRLHPKTVHAHQLFNSTAAVELALETAMCSFHTPTLLMFKVYDTLVHIII